MAREVECPEFEELVVWPMEVQDSNGRRFMHYDLTALGADGRVYRWDRKGGEFVQLPLRAREWEPENPHRQDQSGGKGHRRQFGR